MDSSRERIIELCDIPKCADKIWIAIVGTTAAIILIFIIIFAIILFKRRTIMHYGMRNIHNVSKNLRIYNRVLQLFLQINTPSADKNIYGNSQLNNAQDAGRGNLGNLSDHVALNSKLIERNTLLRINHFTLQDVEFLEELGEGAFGS